MQTLKQTPEQLAKSQAAFEAHYLGYHNIANEDFSKTDGLYNFSYLHRDFEKWRAAEAFGRKQALEDVIAEVQVFEAGGSNVAVVAARIGNKLKGLLND